MANLLDESLISLSESARCFPSLRNGRPVNPSTIFRYHSYGVKRGPETIKLETVKVGGRIATSREAVRRFMARCAGQELPAEQPTAARTNAQKTAAAVLDRAGI